MKNKIYQDLNRYRKRQFNVKIKIFRKNTCYFGNYYNTISRLTEIQMRRKTVMSKSHLFALDSKTEESVENLRFETLSVPNVNHQSHADTRIIIIIILKLLAGLTWTSLLLLVQSICLFLSFLLLLLLILIIIIIIPKRGRRRKRCNCYVITGFHLSRLTMGRTAYLLQLKEEKVAHILMQLYISLPPNNHRLPRGNNGQDNDRIPISLINSTEVRTWFAESIEVTRISLVICISK